MSDKFKIDITEFDEWKSKIIETVEERSKVCKKKLNFRKVSPLLQDEETQKYLKEIHEKFVMVPIDKATNNIAFICKKYYIDRILKEIGLDGTPSTTYEISNQNSETINSINFELCERLYLNIPKDSDALPIMYWIPKLHKTPTGARFIIAAKKNAVSNH